MPTIGTLNEKRLHAALKERHARPGDGVKVKRHGTVVDVAREPLLLVGTNVVKEVEVVGQQGRRGSVANFSEKLATLQRLMPSSGRRSTAR